MIEIHLWATAPLIPFRTMVPSGASDDNIRWSQAMSAMARGGQWQRALALLEAMPQEMLETPSVTGVSRACHTGLGELGGHVVTM